MVSHSTAVNFACIFEDCIDQLHILGKIIPMSYMGKPEARSLVAGNINAVFNNQKLIEAWLANAISFRSGDTKERITIKDLVESLAASNRNIDQTMRQNPLTRDNLSKVEEDRQFCENILVKTCEELLQSHTFHVLLEAVSSQITKKRDSQLMIIKEEQGRRKIKQLQRRLNEVRKERDFEVQHRNEMIAHLKDQLQEMKAKTNMEGKYVKKNAENGVHQNLKHCLLYERKKKSTVETFKIELEKELRTHVEIDAYLKGHQKILEEKVEHWMDKYETDVERKQHDLIVLKTAKAHDWDRLKELQRKYAEYKKVVREYNDWNNKKRAEKEREQLEFSSVVRLQSWWRGMLVVKQLGPFDKRKKKGKKGKKGKKKK